MWRGTTLAKPLRTGSSFIGLGTPRQRMVIYPISAADPDTGLAMINWIAEVTIDDADAASRTGWYNKVEIDDFIHHFEGWTYDWLDVPALIRGADTAYENPMIDRDPVASWVDGPVALMGDAAHPMYPTGSNGASQAIIDTRILGKMLLLYGMSSDALKAYDEGLCESIAKVVLRSRNDGPFGLLTLVEERCGGVFDNIDDVITESERAEFMAQYKTAAGFAIETVNNAAPIIEKGAKLVLA